MSTLPASWSTISLTPAASSGISTWKYVSASTGRCEMVIGSVHVSMSRKRMGGRLGREVGSAICVAASVSSTPSSCMAAQTWCSRLATIVTLTAGRSTGLLAELSRDASERRGQPPARSGLCSSPVRAAWCAMLWRNSVTRLPLREKPSPSEPATTLLLIRSCDSPAGAQPRTVMPPLRSPTPSSTALAPSACREAITLHSSIAVTEGGASSQGASALPPSSAMPSPSAPRQTVPWSWASLGRPPRCRQPACREWKELLRTVSRGGWLRGVGLRKGHVPSGISRLNAGYPSPKRPRPTNSTPSKTASVVAFST
mmetsp:Transcript_31504/g.81512  ORF Transcript_31504/g.81512 Transcript_31504/m.81512 type:complete len:313 (-) Transcript_31504:42-980(-)